MGPDGFLSFYGTYKIMAMKIKITGFDDALALMQERRTGGTVNDVWYAGRIGQTFDVMNQISDRVLYASRPGEHPPGGYVIKKDCVVVQ